MKNLSTILPAPMLPAMAAVTFLLTPATRAVVWDDFQSYASFQVLANGYLPQTGSDSRWGRFGAGTADNPVAKVAIGPLGETAGDYPLLWSIGNNGNLVYHFPTPTNLTATPGFSIALMASYAPPTNTTILAVFEDANGNIWQSIPSVAQSISEAFVWQTNRFVFRPQFMEREAGTTPFDLTSILNLRIRFQNASGDTTAQHIYFFDLESLPPQPVLGQLTFGAGNAVTVPFTSSDDAPADVFVLETSSTVGALAVWVADAGATIQSLGGGTYRADTVRSGNAMQYYRVRR
jgi:hypothetical protein